MLDIKKKKAVKPQIEDKIFRLVKEEHQENALELLFTLTSYMMCPYPIKPLRWFGIG